MKKRTDLFSILALAIMGTFIVMTFLDNSSGLLSSRDSQAPKAAASLLIDNFEDGDLTNLINTKWATFNDNALGGKSEIAAAVVPGGAKRSKKSLRLNGKVTTDFKYGGFAGLRMLFDPSGKGVKDVNPYSGIEFYARGDGRQYRLEVMTAAVKDHSEYGKEFPTSREWKLYQIPFSQLSQPQEFGRKVKWTGTDALGIVFMTSGFPIESYSFQIDEIRFY